MLTKLLTAVGAPRRRPPRAEIEPAALELLRRHGAQIMSTARRYAASPEDAEDAYQRGLEILLTKAPTTSADDLVPWLKTVVKHEAFALRKQRERQGVPTEHEPASVAGSSDTHEQVERLDRLQRGAEAMQRLKPQEIRCMLLLAEGHSYRQIQEITGFSYTKVNRCLTEGRRSFVQRVEGIEAGAECERLAPLVSALADGVATSKDMAALRPHLRTCLSCRAALRDAREAPARVAALAPIGLLAVGGHGGGLRALTGWINERVTTWVLRGQDLLETASSHKLAAAAASAAALGGGGIATVEVSRHHAAPHAHHRHHVHPPTALRVPVAPRSRPPAPIPVRPAPHRHHRKPRPVPKSQAAAPPVIAPTGPAPPPQPAAVPTAEPQTGEFGP